MVGSFDNTTGVYEITLTADEENPFIGDFRININLFNSDTGNNARNSSSFQDALNDYNLAATTTTITLTGSHTSLLAWEAGDRIALSGPEPLGLPDGSGLFRSSVSDIPLVGYMTDEDTIAYEDFATIKDESDFSCSTVDNQLDVDIPCITYQDQLYQATLSFFSNTSTPETLCWTLTNTNVSTNNGNCATASDDLNLKLPCVDVNGTLYNADLKYNHTQAEPPECQFILSAIKKLSLDEDCIGKPKNTSFHNYECIRNGDGTYMIEQHTDGKGVTAIKRYATDASLIKYSDYTCGRTKNNCLLLYTKQENGDIKWYGIRDDLLHTAITRLDFLGNPYNSNYAIDNSRFLQSCTGPDKDENEPSKCSADSVISAFENHQTLLYPIPLSSYIVWGPPFDSHQTRGSSFAPTCSHEVPDLDISDFYDFGEPGFSQCVNETQTSIRLIRDNLIDFLDDLDNF